MSKRWLALLFIEQIVVHACAVIVFLLLFGLLVGCVTPQQAMQMTPEQISAWNQTNEDVYICLSALGPPPNGQFTLIIVPKTAKFNINISPTCQITNGTLSQ